MRSADKKRPEAHSATVGAASQRRVLVANQQLWRYSGSEIHALQLAEYFKEQGDEVIFFAVSTRPWLAAEITARGIEIADWRSLRHELRKGFDIVWTHHEPPFYLLHILCGVRCRLAIHGILSRVVRLERVPLLPLSAQPDKFVILANSVETRDEITARSGQDGISVLLNIVPDAFQAHHKRNYAPELRRVAVVSNHIPDEVIAARNVLKERGVEVDLFGKGHKELLVDQSTLVDFDVVVTIGKTAQYALVQGIPLFLYDVFGGPGYVGPDGFKRHEDFNFSGRSAPQRMSAEDLAQALMDGYAGAAESACELRELYGDRYAIGSQTEWVMARTAAEALPLYGFRARLWSIVVTGLLRPTVPLRLICPEYVDTVGKWLKKKQN
ncbi:MAG: glycosyltransferase [Pseudomonadota bacterium]